MRTLGNILWILLSGFLGGLAWALAGCICCITIIGIPFGRQCFKFASLALFPFGKRVIYGGGNTSLLINSIFIELHDMKIERLKHILMPTSAGVKYAG